jgi:hypothetical protein
MTTRKSEAEMNRQAIMKITRTMVRLKYSLAADKEINQLLPDRLDEFDAALQRGELLELKPSLEE